jgi:iron complex outermembrane receptor protein
LTVTSDQSGHFSVADTPKNVETASLLYQHRNWDIGFVDTRVGTMYNDNGTLNYLIDG